MVVKGLSTSPEPGRYQNPDDVNYNTLGASQVSKTFGSSREMCTSFQKGERRVDSANPGPGHYFPVVIADPKPSMNTRLDSRNSRAQIGFMTHQQKEKGTREERGSMFFNLGKKGNFPGPASYHTSLDITSQTASGLGSKKRYMIKEGKKSTFTKHSDMYSNTLSVNDLPY